MSNVLFYCIAITYSQAYSQYDSNSSRMVMCNDDIIIMIPVLLTWRDDNE